MNNLQDVFLTATASVFSQIAAFLPRILGAVLVFLIGVILSNWAKALTRKLSSVINLGKLLRGTSVEKFLLRADMPAGLDELLGQVVRWLILLIFFIATTNLLGLTAVSQVLGAILAYIPNVLAATLILVLGTLVAGLLEGVVKGSLASFNIQAGRLLGKVTSYTIMVFAILAAISQLNIAAAFVQTIFTGFIAMLALGFGLAIGLGAKDTVSAIISDWYKKVK